MQRIRFRFLYRSICGYTFTLGILRFLFVAQLVCKTGVLLQWKEPFNETCCSSGSRGGRGGHGPPGPVKKGHKKDGRQRRPHRFHVSRPPPYPVAGSATVLTLPSYTILMTACSVFSLRFWCHWPIRASNFKIKLPRQKFTHPDSPLQKIN